LGRKKNELGANTIIEEERKLQKKKEASGKEEMLGSHHQ